MILCHVDILYFIIWFVLSLFSYTGKIEVEHVISKKLQLKRKAEVSQFECSEGSSCTPKCGFHHINASLFCHPAGNQLFSIDGSPLQSKICYTLFCLWIDFSLSQSSVSCIMKSKSCICSDIRKYGLSFKLGGALCSFEENNSKKLSQNVNIDNINKE